MTARHIRTEPQRDAAHHYEGMAAEARRDRLFNSVRVLVRTDNGRRWIRLTAEDGEKFENGAWSAEASEGMTRSAWAILRDTGARDQIQRAVSLDIAAMRAETHGQAASLHYKAEQVRRRLSTRHLRTPDTTDLLGELHGYSCEPGRFAAAPDVAAVDAFRRGMQLGRRMERRDGGAVVQSPRAVICAGHVDPPPPHGRTGLYFLIAVAVVTAAVSALMVLA